MAAEFYVVRTPCTAPNTTPDFIALEDSWRQRIGEIDRVERIKLFDAGECLTPDSRRVLELSRDVMRSYDVKETKTDRRGCRDGCSYVFKLLETGADLSFVQVLGGTCNGQERAQLWAVIRPGLFTSLVEDICESLS